MLILKSNGKVFIPEVNAISDLDLARVAGVFACRVSTTLSEVVCSFGEEVNLASWISKTRYPVLVGEDELEVTEPEYQTRSFACHTSD